MNGLVLAMNSGSIQDQSFADPSLVTAGHIAFFEVGGDALIIDGADSEDVEAIPDSFFIVRGEENGVMMRTGILKRSLIEKVIKETYSAPTKQVTTISGLATGTAGEHIVGVQDLTTGYQPFPRITANFVTTASHTLPQIVVGLGAIINAIVRSPVDAMSNKRTTLTLTGTSGTANVAIDGTNYLATFEDDLTTTAANFVTAHAATILGTHGLVVTANAGVLTFAPDVDNSTDFTAPTATNASGDLAGTTATSQAITQLILTAKEFKTSFNTTLDELSVTATRTATATPDYGSGVGADIYFQEKENRARAYGEYYTNSGILGRPEEAPIFTDADGQYTVYVIRHKNDQEDSINRAFKYTEIVIALESATTGDLDTFFADYL